MKNLLKKVLSLLLVAIMVAGMIPLAVVGSADDSTGSSYMRIFHLDCGRKYFTPKWVKALIVELSAAGYTHLELAVGNDGMRFILDDTSVTVGSTVYASQTVADAIKAGNKAYNGDESYWTEEDMDGIMAVAAARGIEIIPLINTPGHMDAILDAGEAATGKTLSYNGSARTIDVTNSAATAFTKAFVVKYAQYFKNNGCKYINIGADEYANDIYTGGSMGFGNLVSSGNYSSFVTYVNDLDNALKGIGLSTLMFNDGVYFNGNTSSGTFNTDITVCYWSSGWGGYQSATPANLVQRGHSVINVNGDFYYVLGKDDAFTSGSSTTHNGDYSAAANFSNTEFMSASGINGVGSMFCVWCDYPNAETETEIAKNVRLLLRAMGARMQDQTIDTISTDDIKGGFAADGSIIPGDTVIRPTILTEGDTDKFYVGNSMSFYSSDGKAVEWSVDDDTVAKLATAADENGRSTLATLTSLKAGTVTLKATDEAGYEYTITVTVKPLPHTDITAPEPGTVTGTGDSVTYVLDTDGVDSGEKYLIVASDDAMAMYASSKTAASAQSITINGRYAEISQNESYALWTFTAYGTGYRVYNAERGVYLGIAYSGVSLATSVSTLSVNANGTTAGNYTVRSTYYSRYLRYSNGRFTSNRNSGTVRLYKQVITTASYSVGTDGLEYILGAANTAAGIKNAYSNWDELGLDALIAAASSALASTEKKYTDESAANAQQTVVNNAADALYQAMTQLSTKAKYEAMIFAREQGTETLLDYAEVVVYEGENVLVAAELFGDIRGYKPVEAQKTVTVTGDISVTFYYVPKTAYTVSYSWTGTGGTPAIDPPADETVYEGDTYTVDTVYVNGYSYDNGDTTRYVFGGWKLNGADAPETVTVTGNMEFTGTWTFIDFDISTLGTKTVEYWITNGRLKDAGGNEEKTVSSTDDGIYSENGVALADIAPKTGTRESRTVYFWRGRLLDKTATNDSTSETEEQTGNSGDDDTTSGRLFTRLRCWNAAWQALTDTDGWVNITENHQLVAYYLELINVSDELTVNAADWGKKGDGSASSDYLSTSNVNTISVMVVYDDGTTNPIDTTADKLATNTICYDYWTSGRGIGTLYFNGEGNFDIYKITAETGEHTGTSTGNYGTYTVNSFTWDNNETTVWEGDPVNSQSISNRANNPNTDGIYQNLQWDENKESILIRVYIKAKATKDSLTVRYFDRSMGDTEFYNYQITVAQDTKFDKNIGLDTPWKGDLKNGSVPGYIDGVTNTVSADLSSMPEIEAAYKYSEYTCVEVVRSDDGKTVSLYYTFNNAHYFVIDFGKPLHITKSNINISGDWIKATITNGTYGTATIAVGQPLTYTPTSVLHSYDRLQITLEDTNGTKATHYIYIIPATNVYYEETFMEYEGFVHEGNSVVASQAAEEEGKKVNNYGFDPAYTGIEAGPSDMTDLVSDTEGSTATFTFTGTGVDIYTCNATDSGALMVALKSDGKTKKLYFVDTCMRQGEDSGHSTGKQDVITYNVPVVCIRDLAHGTYTVEITHIEAGGTAARAVTSAVELDGFRVYNTINGDTSYGTYALDGENSPVYVELRDEILKSSLVRFDVLSDSQYAKSIAQGVISQIYTADEAGKISVPNVFYVINGSDETILTTGKGVLDWMDNGPKNEVYVYPGDSVTFTATSDFQIGMRSLNELTTATVNVDGTENSIDLPTVDMYYSVSAGTVTITNSGIGYLAITKLKFTGGTAANNALKGTNVAALTEALSAIGFENDGSAVEYSTGDISGDGYVNAIDILLARRALVGLYDTNALQTAAADINGDGRVNAIDINLMRRMLVGLYK